MYVVTGAQATTLYAQNYVRFLLFYNNFSITFSEKIRSVSLSVPLI